MIKTTTKTGQYMTLQYAAPEQIDKKKFGEVDWRTDIWQMANRMPTVRNAHRKTTIPGRKPTRTSNKNNSRKPEI